MRTRRTRPPGRPRPPGGGAPLGGQPGRRSSPGSSRRRTGAARNLARTAVPAPGTGRDRRRPDRSLGALEKRRAWDSLGARVPAARRVRSAKWPVPAGSATKRQDPDVPGRGPVLRAMERLEVHVSATVAMAAAVAVVLLLGKVGHERLRREDHRRDGRRVLERGAVTLAASTMPCSNMSAVFALERVEALFPSAVLDALDDDLAALARVIRDLLGRAPGHVARCDADLLVSLEVEGVQGRIAWSSGRFRRRHDPFLDGRAGRGEGVLDPVLLLLEL